MNKKSYPGEAAVLDALTPEEQERVANKNSLDFLFGR